MKKLLLAVIVLTLTGCSSFGKGITEALLEHSKKEDTRQCEIRGSKIAGINSYFAKGKTVKVMMIHGVGTHTPGYATRLQENLATYLGLDVLSRRPKDIVLINPTDGKTPIGNLRITRMENEDGSKDMLFYELTWSEITNPQKKILAYDYSGQYDYKRAAFNNTTKKFMDDTVPDPMIYLMDKDNLILNAAKQSTCWMLSSGWQDLKNNQRKVCQVSSYSQLQDLSKENIVFITHSLGSRILMDSVIDIVEDISAASKSRHSEANRIIKDLQNKEITVYMLANQLPLLQIGREKPSVTNQIPQYCHPKGKNHNRRVFNKVNVIAFNDPNDILSYELRQDFVDDYIDSRMCPTVTNVNLNIAEEISAFGVGVVNPITAHTEYDNDARIIEMISFGTKNMGKDDATAHKCRFIRLKN